MLYGVTAPKHVPTNLQKKQNRAARIITRADYSIRSSDVLNSLEWSNLEERRMSEAKERGMSENQLAEPFTVFK